VTSDQKRQRPLIRYAGSAAETSIGSKSIGNELIAKFYSKQYFCQACFGLAQSRAYLPVWRRTAAPNTAPQQALAG
jgi:hypothetical protein